MRITLRGPARKFNSVQTSFSWICGVGTAAPRSTMDALFFLSGRRDIHSEEEDDDDEDDPWETSDGGAICFHFS